MDTMRIPYLMALVISILQTPTSNAVGARNVLAIPEKIIGGVIDIVQSHKNKPSQQSSFQQTVQTQQSFAQQGYPQNPPYQPWNGQNQNYNNQGFAGQAQIQAQGQFGVNQGSYPTNTNYPTNPSYPPQNNFPVNGQYQQNYGQTPVQGQYQNNNQQSGGQYQNQQGFVSSQFQGQNQGSFQNGQYGSGNYQGSQGTGQYGQGGNFQGQNVQTGQSGHYQGQNVQTGQGGNYQGQNVQTGQFVQGASQNGQFNQQSGQSGQTSQSGHYQTSQSQTVGGQSGSFTTQGSSGSFQGSNVQHQKPNGSSCVCQTFTKPPEVVADTPGKSVNATEQKIDPKMMFKYY